MDTLAKADIFFFVTTIAVIVFLVLGSIAMYYLIGVLRNVKRASDKLEQEVDSMRDHAEHLYTKVSESVLFNLLFGRKSKRRAHKAD